MKYCGKCRTPKEALYPTDLQAQGFTKHPVMCKCAAERRERKEAKRREYERMSCMTMLRSEAFRDMPAADWRFESAAVTTPQLAKARGYAQNWDEFKKAGIGLLLFGNVGTGKSYAAGCIANALIDRLESVLFVGMSDVVNRMQGNFGADRDHYMQSLMCPDLLVLDDLGAERNTSFSKECVFDVVDKRLLTGKPMIVTTNIQLSVMMQAADLDDRRIFDRILEVCVPIRFDGENFRKGNARANIKKAAEMLNG
ncbi:ATP-binding protein [Clostridiaceae bacterium Marseille-Q4149]|nr:ATP-binding protein [Clostridiaceae bacterium Marseille-Q4149]